MRCLARRLNRADLPTFGRPTIATVGTTRIKKWDRAAAIALEFAGPRKTRRRTPRQQVAYHISKKCDAYAPMNIWPRIAASATISQLGAFQTINRPNRRAAMAKSVGAWTELVKTGE